MAATNPTACLLVIGNEVLSGRTQDANIRFLATGLGELGIPLREVRVIPDVPQTIIDTVNEVRREIRLRVHHRRHRPDARRHHQRMRRRGVRRAVGAASGRLGAHGASYKPGDFNAARQRMATMPRGATLIDNALSVAPGFQIGNVYVMAGVPRVMQSMFEWLAPRLQGGPKIESRAVHAIGLPEGMIAEGLGAIQAQYPQIDLGSYPFYRPERQRRGAGRQGHRRCRGRGGDRRGHRADHRDLARCRYRGSRRGHKSAAYSGQAICVLRLSGIVRRAHSRFTSLRSNLLEHFHREWNCRNNLSLREAKRRSNPVPDERTSAREARDCFVASLLAMTRLAGFSTHGENALMHQCNNRTCLRQSKLHRS